MQHLEGSGTTVLYIGRTVLEGSARINNVIIVLSQIKYVLIIIPTAHGIMQNGIVPRRSVLKINER